MARTVEGEQALRKHLSVVDGFVLYTSAVLGQSLIVLPSIAARHAGPWSILIWAGLAAVSYPLARIMAELGARYPSAGGVLAFIGQGLGRPIGRLTGTLYLAAIAVGGPATALIFSEYLGRLVPLPGRWPLVVAALELGVLVAGNCFDVSRVMRLQRWVFLGCLTAVVAALLLALPHVSTARLTDLRGYTLGDVASTGLICFFAFVGWENAAFSGEEFAQPRTLVKALWLAVAAAGTLFVLLGVTVVGSLSRSVLATSDASLADLARLSLGDAGARAAAVIALVLLLVFMFTWARSATRLIFALARDRDGDGYSLLPRRLSVVDRTTGAPRRAALALGGIWAAVIVVQVVLNVPIEVYIQLSSGNFLLTYVLIVVSAWRLLETRRYLPALVCASGAIVALVAAGFASLWYAVGTAALFSLVYLVRLARLARLARLGLGNRQRLDGGGAEPGGMQEPHGREQQADDADDRSGATPAG